MKKVLALVLAAIMMLCASAMADTSVSDVAAELTGDVSALKVGAIILGDENEGYSYAHIAGIQNAAEKLGVSADQIIWKYHIGEDGACYNAAADLADAGCNLIFSNSYGHQTYMMQAAAEFPEVQFVAMTGDTANKSGMDNFSNAFTEVYQSRYVSGVVAGMKLAEQVANDALAAENYDADGNIKLGYVGAYPYAEVVSGYTAYYLGVKSVVENVVMDVTYTNSWFDITAEAEAANALMASGCAMICQHADSTGAPSAVQAAHDAGNANVFSVGYNIDMISVAPDVALTSPQNNWQVAYEEIMKTAMDGGALKTDYCNGYAEDGVMISTLGTPCAAGTQEAVDTAIAAIKDGSLHVFDTSKFTVGGAAVTSAFATDTDGDYTNDADEAVFDGYYHESYFQAAPSFSLRIDGITELN